MLLGNHFDVTWYSVGNKSAMGTPLKANHTVAITRNLIPKGSKVKIVLPDGEVLYRFAEDVTGKKGDAKSCNGRLVDIYVPSKADIPSVGRLHGVKVYLVKE